jgi:hypothetical protein
MMQVACVELDHNLSDFEGTYKISFLAFGEMTFKMIRTVPISERPNKISCTGVDMT